MKKLILWAALPISLLYISCGDSAQKNEPKPIVPKSYVKADTVTFENDKDRFIIVGRTELGPYLKDSSRVQQIEMILYKGGKPVAIHTDSALNFGEEYISHHFEGQMGEENYCQHFVNITYGYGACGYTQNHFLMNVTSDNMYFVTKHSSSGDGPYGYGTNFYNACLDKSKTQITSVNMSYSPEDEESTEETIMIDVNYSDSTVYDFDGKAWKAKLVTEKEKVFRKEKSQL